MDFAQLERLHEIVRAADEWTQRPPAEGETSRPFEHYLDFIGDEGERLGWQLVGALRGRAADLFGSFSEEGLHKAALDVIVSADRPPTVADVAAALRDAAASDEGPWLVVMPLANVRLDRGWAPLGSHAAIQRAPDEHLHTGDDPEDRDDEDLLARAAIQDHLGDYLAPSARMLTITRQIDTGRAASIIFKEAGRPSAAIEAARAKTLYALATWAVLAPPVGWHIMPELANWTPQPALLQRPHHKRFEAARWGRTEPRRGGDYRSWSPYELPADAVLAAPFEAFERLDRRSAQALLSSTVAVHAGSRATRAQVAERLRDVMAALECLCVAPTGVRGRPEERWRRLAARFDVWDQVARRRAYTPAQIAELQKRITDARNISSHRAEAALLDLGWSAGGGRRLRGRGGRPSKDLARAAIQRDIDPLLYAVSEALRKTWTAMRAADFDDEAFEALFA
jgi:hypothetical protein